MPIDPQIPLSVQMPQQQQFNPMQSIGALMQMKNVASEVALRDAQVEQARQHTLDMKVETDQRNADLKDQNTLQEMMGNPEISTKIGSGDLTPFYGKVQQKTLDALATNINKHHTDLATATKTDLENRGTALGEITNGVTGLLGFGDDIGKVNAALPGLKQQLMDSGTFKLAKIDPAKVPDSVASADDLQRWLASVGLASAANAKVLANKEAETKLTAPNEKTITTDKGILGFNPKTGTYDVMLGQAPDKKTAGATTVTTDEGVMQWNPETNRYDIKAGGAPVKSASSTPEQQFIDEYRAKRPQASIAEAQHAFEVNKKTAEPGAGAGTWALQEDSSGKQILFNSKTGETRQPPAGMQKLGTDAKTKAPARDALQYATTYLASPQHTGSGDEALMEKFFELAKPSTGFRMTQPQQDMLKSSQGWMGSLEAKGRHALTGTWFSDDQRKQIVGTMQALANSKLGGAQPSAAPATDGVKIPATQAEYNALPKGAQFRKPNDPTIYTKQ